MLREDGVDDLRDDGVFVADDAGKERGLRRPGRAEFCDEIFAKLVLDRAADAGWGVFTGAESAEGLGKRDRHGASIDVWQGWFGAAGMGLGWIWPGL